MIHILRLELGNVRELFLLPLSLEDFGRLRKFSDIFGNLRMCCVVSENLMPITQKKLAGIAL